MYATCCIILCDIDNNWVLRMFTSCTLLTLCKTFLLMVVDLVRDIPREDSDHGKVVTKLGHSHEE